MAGRRRGKYIVDSPPELESRQDFLIRTLRPSRRLRGFSWTLERAFALWLVLRDYDWSHPRYYHGKENTHCFWDESFAIVSAVTGFTEEMLREKIGLEDVEWPKEEIINELFTFNEIRVWKWGPIEAERYHATLLAQQEKKK